MRLQLQCLLKSTVFVVVLSCWGISPAFSACHCVTPSGSGSKTGADWNNAYAGLPASPVRGDVYYLADGTYAANYQITVAPSGTTSVTFRKAQSYDHCTDTGWNTSTMGSSQAILPRAVAISTSYVTFDGNGRQSSPGCGGAPGGTVSASPPTPSDCGIKLDGSACSGGANSCNAILWYPANVTGSTFRYVELAANGDNNSEQFEIFAGGGGESATYTHMYGHNSGCVYFQDGLDGVSITYSYFWGTEVNGATGGCHGQFMYDNGADSNGVMANNVFRDIAGTAIWTFANSSTTHNNWVFYNNVVWNSSPPVSWTAGVSDGVVACINAGTNCTNFMFVQNTIVNLPITSSSAINNENTGSYTVENNLWYNCAYSPTLYAGTNGTYTENYNSYLNSVRPTVPGGTGAQDVVLTTGAPNPFVNWTTGNFNLASENSDWDSRLSLSSPYTTDVNGNTFTSDRGAYQSVLAVQPPSSLTAAPH